MRPGGCVASPPDTYLPSAPSIPATIPRTAPITNPPPITKLNAAKGNARKAPNTPRRDIIIIPPVSTMSPAMRPTSTANG